MLFFLLEHLKMYVKAAGYVICGFYSFYRNKAAGYFVALFLFYVILDKKVNRKLCEIEGRAY